MRKNAKDCNRPSLSGRQQNDIFCVAVLRFSTRNKNTTTDRNERLLDWKYYRIWVFDEIIILLSRIINWYSVLQMAWKLANGIGAGKVEKNNRK